MARHHARITAIRDKLNQIIIPPRDPTPESPQKQRTTDVDVKRIKLRAPSDKPGPIGRPRRGNSYTAAHTPRSRRNHHADDKDDDGWEDIPPSPRHYDRLKKKKKGPGIPKRGPKPSGDPPFLGGASSRYDNGTLIPNHLLPWNRLTNEELAKLRKRMKKNSGWTPSVTMIIRELESLGRGPKHKEKYEDQWGGSRGEEFLKIYGPEDGGTGDPEMIAPDDGAGVRENKGMRLNRAKKRKREEERKEKEREAERERVLADRERDKLRKQEEELRERREREEKEKELEEAEREKAAAIALAKEKQERQERQERQEKQEKQERQEKEEKEEAAKEKAAAKERENAAANAVSSKSTRSASISTTKTVVTADEDEAMPDVEVELPPPPPPKPRLGRPPKHLPAASPPSSGEKRKRALSTTAIPVLSLAESRVKRGESAVAPPPATVSLAVGRKRANSTAGAKPTQKATKPAKKKGLVAGNSRKRGADTPGTDGAGEWVDDDEDEDLNKYCLCDEVSRGTMVLCDNEQVKLCCPPLILKLELTTTPPLTVLETVVSHRMCRVVGRRSEK